LACESQFAPTGQLRLSASSILANRSEQMREPDAGSNRWLSTARQLAAA
jgi:hypothetical protein